MTPVWFRHAPGTLTRLMNRAVSGPAGCADYFEDLVVYVDSWFSHRQQIKALFDRLAEAKFTVNLATCEFACATLIYCDWAGEWGSCAVSTVCHEEKELMRVFGIVDSFCKNFFQS